MKESKEVNVKGLLKVFNDPKNNLNVVAVDHIDLQVKAGSLTTILGPSGCGKTTILRMIAGFEKPDEGEIFLGKERMNDLTPHKRDMSMVFQSYSLFPHYNVFDNVAYGLKLKRYPKDEIHDKVMKMLELVDLAGMENRMTNQLSGGEQQRVAIARALVVEPALLLFDEPLSVLDSKLRVSLRSEIRSIVKKVGITTLYVTNNQEEALSISDDIIVMKAGKIVQTGTPQDIYYRPNHEFVAGFIGDTNFLTVRVVNNDASNTTVDLYGKNIRIYDTIPRVPGSICTILLRPESVSISEHGFLPCEVCDSCFMGDYQLYFVKIADEIIKVKEYNPYAKLIYQKGDQAFLDFTENSLHILN
ncbi:MAG: ABC transporter ATP-binding protein [Lachnospiraceae bacterium]|nr:ABC transporter ATP-binding protein [Lachnospiraceae bacterium]